METVFRLRIFHLVMLACPCGNSMCAFAAVFSEKSAIFKAKVARTSFLGFFDTFLGTSASSLGISHSS